MGLHSVVLSKFYGSGSFVIKFYGSGSETDLTNFIIMLWDLIKFLFQSIYLSLNPKVKLYKGKKKLYMIRLLELQGSRM